jgi:hypothetical protein
MRIQPAETFWPMVQGSFVPWIRYSSEPTHSAATEHPEQRREPAAGLIILAIGQKFLPTSKAQHAGSQFSFQGW